MEKSSIENIFRKGLESYEIQPDEDEWSAVDLALPRINFFRFSFVNFNIYYCSLIVLCFLFSALSLIYTLSGGNFRTNSAVAGEKEKIENPIVDKDGKAGLTQINKDGKSLSAQKVPVEKVKSRILVKTESLSINNNSTDLNKSISQPINLDTSRNKENMLQPNRIETNQTLSELSQPEQQKKKDARKKRIVYITKQDTIVVIDTLRKPKRKN